MHACTSAMYIHVPQLSQNVSTILPFTQTCTPSHPMLQPSGHDLNLDYYNLKLNGILI
jgi:hypothetical protein